MVVYVCEKCGKQFLRVPDFQDHIASNNGCEIFLNKTIECNLCNSKFTSEKGLKNHKHNIHNVPRPMNANKKLELELELLKNRMAELEKIKRKPGRPKKQTNNSSIQGNNNNITNITADTVNNTNNINTTNIGNQQINQQIIMVDYGKEEISRLTLEEKKAILNAKYDAIRKCAELLHCNPNKPELRNILVTNLRSNMAQLYKNGKFRVKTKDSMLEDFVRDKASNVQEILDEDDIEISASIREKLEHLLSLVDEDDPNQMKMLKKELEILLYEENRYIIS